MFDLVAGLPVHPLVVHAVVVLLPVMAVVTVVVTARRGWRGALGWVVLADALVLAAAVVAVESGEALQSRLSRGGEPVAYEHGEVGDLVPYFALALLLAAAFAWFATRRGGVFLPLGVAVVSVAAVVAIGVAVVVGHSGAEAVWEEEVAGTSVPVDSD